MTQNLSIRQSDGISVSLDWNSDTQEISVSVHTATDDFTLREIPHKLALDVFNHPYAYASRLLVAGTFAGISRHPDFTVIPTAATYGDGESA